MAWSLGVYGCSVYRGRLDFSSVWRVRAVRIVCPVCAVGMGCRNILIDKKLKTKIV